MKIKLPPFVRVWDESKQNGAVYILFPNFQSTAAFLKECGEEVIKKVEISIFGLFVEIENKPFDMFEVDDRQMLADNYMLEDDIKMALTEKNWKQRGFLDFELDVEGYAPFYLYHDDEKIKWVLTMYGMGPNIISFDWPNTAAIESIFSLCSRYAKKCSFK